MKTDPDDFRRLYSSLNDDALLAIDREELVPLAQQCYDVELAARGLDAAAEPEASDAAAIPPAEDFVQVAVFTDGAEAQFARSLLRFADIPCFLNTDQALLGAFSGAIGEIRLLVPSDRLEQAREALDSEISDEELAAQAEAAAAELEEDEQEEAEPEE